MIYLGIDPGTNPREPGGIGVIQEQLLTTSVDCWPMPEDNMQIYLLIQGLADFISDNAVCCIERQEIFKGNSSQSSRTLVMHYGGLLMALDALGIETHQVGPKVWQASILGPISKGGTKEASLDYARRSWPELEIQLEKSTDHGKSDAMCLAQYAKVLKRIGG